MAQNVDVNIQLSIRVKIFYAPIAILSTYS